MDKLFGTASDSGRNVYKAMKMYPENVYKFQRKIAKHTLEIGSLNLIQQNLKTENEKLKNVLKDYLNNFFI